MGYDNLLAYTEVDPNSRITVTAARATGTGVTRNEDAYVYLDKGADFFDTLDVDCVIKMTAVAVGDCDTATLCLSNVVNDISGFDATDMYIMFSKNSGVLTINLCRGFSMVYDSWRCALNTVYYCTITRAAANDTIECKIYSDEARSNLLDTLSVSGFAGEKWRYIYAINTVNIRWYMGMNLYCENITYSGSEDAKRTPALALAGTMFF